MNTYQGNPVSKGVAVGKVYKYVPYKSKVEQDSISRDQVGEALSAYREARGRAEAELTLLQGTLGRTDPEKAAIVGAHLEILKDPALDEMVTGYIQNENYNVKWAVDRTFTRFIKMLSRVKDDMIRERVADMKDVRTRLLRCCDNAPEVNLSALTEPVIVAAEDLFPSDTASLNRAMVQAIVTEVGGSTSHTAIIARSYEIPALLGVTGAMEFLLEGERVGVDAIGGTLTTQMDEKTVALLEQKAERYRVHVAETKRYLDIEPVTLDGVRIEIDLNIGSSSPAELEGTAHTDGVGLFRSEFLYMGRESLPSEDEQVEIYTRVLKAFEGKPVTLRTLDIGGDKRLDCLELPKEDNPFLGNRALRLCFTCPEIFKTQLRAALRAAVAGDLWVMFPMVGSMDDIRRAKTMVEEAKEELCAEQLPFGKIKIGIMIEIPSIALIADMAAAEVDFASIGTNDLCQYTTAADRMNPAVSRYYQKYHPAMFRLIGHIVRTFRAAGKPICVCGEMAGDELGAAVLVGFGMRKLSMGLANVAQTKKMITKMTIERAGELAAAVCGLSTEAEAAAYLNEALKDIL